MCHDHDSAPPVPRISGAAVSHDDLVLEAADGNRFAAFAATPDERPGPASSSSRTSAGSIASTRSSRCGSRSVATRPLRSTTSAGRPGSGSATTTSSTCRTATRRLRKASRPTSAPRSTTCARRDAARSSPSASASADAIRGSRRPAATASQARSASTAGLAWDATAHPGRRSAPRNRGPDPRAHGRRRPRHPRRGGGCLRDALGAAGVEHELIVYPGAPHSFFDRKQEQFAGSPRTPGIASFAFLAR